MRRSYRIWNNVTACIYKSSRSWGVKNEGNVEVLVGASRHNNASLVNHRVTRRTIERDGVEMESFHFYIDGNLYARQLWSVNKNGVPQKMISSEKVTFNSLEEL